MRKALKAMRVVLIAAAVAMTGGPADTEAQADEETSRVSKTGTVAIGPRPRAEPGERRKVDLDPRRVPYAPPEPPAADRPVVGHFESARTVPPTEPASREARRDRADTRARSSSANAVEIFRNTVVTTSTSRAVEPNAANNLNGIIATGNRYALVSDDNGLTFSAETIDPYDGGRGGGFCCDQVAYAVDRGDHSLVLWLMQDYPDEVTGEDGALRLRMFKDRGDLLAGQDSCAWDWYTTDFKLGARKWFDFNQMSHTSKYLYITSNVRKSTEPYDDPIKHARVGAVIFRIALSDLERDDCQISADYWDRDEDLYITPVQNGGFTMHFASHHADGFKHLGQKLRLYSVADSSGVLESKTKNIDNFEAVERKCALPDGTNPCGGQHPGRMSGFHSGNTIGWLWNAGQDKNHPWPHVRVAVFEAGSKKKLVEHSIFSDSVAWQLPSVGVNENGHLGVILYAMGGSLFPSVQAFIRTDPTNWDGIETTLVSSSTASGTGGDKEISDWGHYGSVRPYHGCAETFLGSAFTSHDGASTATGEEQRGRVVWFGKPGSGCEDLAMKAVTLGAAARGARTYTLGDSIDVTTNVQNQGSAVSAASRIGYYLSRDEVFDDGDIPFTTAATAISLDVEESHRLTTTLTLPSTPAIGMNFHVIACADDDNQIDEITAANNCAATRQAITVATAPDLVMMRVRVATTRGARTFLIGDPIDVATVIQNQGSVLASASPIGYYLSSDETLDDGDISFGTNRTANALDPNERHTLTAGLRVPQALSPEPRDYFVIACADDLKNVKELSNRNNCAATRRTITVTTPSWAQPPTPDLDVVP